MKRIVNGVTYDTETATKLAQAEWEEGGGDIITGTLYQTRGGAFFAYKEISSKVWSHRARGHITKVRHECEPLSPEDAHKWLLEGDVEIFANPFDDPPEATAEAEPGATIYIRVPASLKRRVEQAAEKENVSGNAWAMRCIESCLLKQGA